MINIEKNKKEINMIQKITKKMINLAKTRFRGNELKIECIYRDSALEIDIKNKNNKLIDTIRISKNNDKSTNEQKAAVIYNMFTNAQKARFQNESKRTIIKEKEILKALNKIELIEQNKKPIQKQNG